MERLLNTSGMRVSALLILLLAFTAEARAAEIRVSGISAPYRDVILSAPTQGVIEAVRAAEGQVVKQGQILIELERTTESLEVDRHQLILDDKSEVTVAEERIKTLMVALESTRKLFGSTGSVSKEDVATKELEYKQAVAEQARLAAAEKRQELDLRLAREDLRRKIIRSPLDGTVVELPFDEGEGCKAQDPLIRIVNTSRFYFEANVEARDGQALKEGDSVKVEFGAPGKVTRFDGKLSFVSPVVDPSSGLIRVKALCENPEARIKPGINGILILQLQ